MKIGSGRFKFGLKVPDAPPSPTPSSPNTSNSSSSTPSSPNVSSSSKSSPHLVYSDNPNNNNNNNTNNKQELYSIDINNNSRIISSQSKSSGALLQKQRWDGNNNRSSSPDDIYQLLAEQKLTEQMIWCGHPDLFPIIHQYSDLLSSSTTANSNNSGNILSINLPLSSEFGDIKKKSYKIGKKLTIAQTVNLICKKQSIKEPRRFWLSTLMGCILNDDMLLSSYGFGTFFDSWELSLVLKQQFTDRVLIDLPLDNFGEYVVDFQLPPLKQFGGLKKKRIKVDSSSTISAIIGQICNKYKIDDPDQLSLITNDEFPLILNNNATLGHYGLGNKFTTLELSIVFTELIPPYSLRNNNVPTYGAFQVGTVDPVQSKAVIIDLENKLQDHLKLGEEMIVNIKDLAAALSEKQQELKDKDQEIKEKEQQHFTVMNHIEEKLTKIKVNVTAERETHLKQIADIKQEKEVLSDTIKSLKAQLEELNSKLYQERSANTESTISFNFKLSSLQEKYDSLTEENQELQSSLKDTEDRLDQLHYQKQDDNQRLEKEKFELVQKYESIIKNLQTTYEDKIKSIFDQQQQQEKEQQEITNRIFNDIESSSNSSSSKTNTIDQLLLNTNISSDNNTNGGFSSIEREQLLSSVSRLNQEITDRDVIIKQVYPKKIQNLESTNKKLDEKLKESDNVNQQSKQTIALKSLEITELQRQIELLNQNNKDTQSKLDFIDNQHKEEELKNRKLLSDISNVKNLYESQLLISEQKQTTIQQMEQTRIDLELKFKEREASLLYDIQELKKPKPPPLPAFKVVAPKTPDTKNDKSINDIKNGLKPVPNLPPPVREHTIATVADLLFVSMQKRFQSIQGPDIENLDDDIDDNDDYENNFDD